MKTPVRSILGIGIFIACLASATAVTTTNGVFQLTLSGSGAIQDDISGVPTVGKAKITDAALKNLAMGRSLDALPVANEVLAIAVDVASDDAWIMVYDTAGVSNKAMVAVVYDGCHIEGVKGGAFMLSMDVQHVGGASFGLDAGNLMVSGKYSVDSLGHVTKVSASVSGFIHIIVTDDTGTHSVEVAMPKGKLTIGSKVGDFVP